MTGKLIRLGRCNAHWALLGWRWTWGVTRPANPASGEVKDSLRKNMAHDSPEEWERICEGKKGRWEFLGRVIRRPINIHHKYATTLLLCMLAPSCPTFCDPMNCSPSGSSVHKISQARLLEWVVISLSRGSSWPSDQTRVSCIGRHVLYCWATRSPYIHAYILYILASLVARW